MKTSEETQNLLTAHYKEYPQLQIQDLFKFVFQSSFGCEHMISSAERAIAYIREESKNVSGCNNSLIDKLDGKYSRVHLGWLNQGLSADTLGRLFYLSARKEYNGITALENKLTIAKELIKERTLPFSIKEFEDAVSDWKANGYPAVHHSEVFRSYYKPAYRVIDNKFIPFLPLFARLDKMLKNGRIVLAIEGGSASGKSTLGKMLEEIYCCTVFHMDDFFLRPEQRTPERYAEVGGNIDRERFSQEVLVPLSKNEPIEYRRFDCSTMKILPPVSIVPQKLTVIEGAYSMHPEFEKSYDLSVYLDISPQLQRERITKRNSQNMAQRFFNEWIPLEKQYFSKLGIPEHCDMIIDIL